MLKVPAPQRPLNFHHSQCEPTETSACRCGEQSRLQCPKCLELGIPKGVSVFCSQECFKAGWAEHKSLHKPTDDSYMYVLQAGRMRSLHMPQWDWTGSLRPYRCGAKRSRTLNHNNPADVFFLLHPLGAFCLSGTRPRFPNRVCEKQL